MARRKKKQVSFDAMVKFFMQQYDIPTRKDIDRLLARMDQLEALIHAVADNIGKSGSRKGGPTRNATFRRATNKTAADTVLEVIKRFKNGVAFAEIQARTGFEDKKLRNIIFRLHRLGKITRISRGIYTSAI
jgi:hypothetical protein